jgi:phosphate transport system ATP-binding protein
MNAAVTPAPEGKLPPVDSELKGLRVRNREGASELHVRAHIKNLHFYYGKKQALQGVNLQIVDRAVTAFIGPSGCGKSTLLRCFNRMHDFYPGNRYDGEIILYPEAINVLAPETDPVAMRLRTGMVFQKPNPFPKTIFENVAYGLRLRGIKDKTYLNHRVEQTLRASALWDEVADRLHRKATELSGGQQQRLCFARALANDPEILLLDEPTSALDPIATARIEEMILQLKETITILMVTHNMEQAARVSDVTAFMYIGELIESAATEEIFERPKKDLTEKYLTGRFG